MNIFDGIAQILDEEPMGQEPLPSFSLKSGEHLNKAYIASDLKPRTENRITSGSRAYIVGNDGPNITADKYPWVDLLDEWIEKGCDISYLLLTKPSEKTLELLRPLAQKKAVGRGHLSIFTVNNSPKPDDSAADYLEQWKTFHFAVFENPKQLWIESHHKPGETTAQDCYYFEPKVAEKTPLLDVCKSRFDYVVQNYCEQISLDA